ncbi:amidohydrolase family protein [Achromobacter mucicolens]|uniref:metal-dependent hydrolase family protein n=1 Tax=Achromobacter mucicolens TaxID=1389922 RepID=UPI00244D3998|nr:amidohydrolase family protein [Achromobacter mucicolens]MDH0091404.1 amidohydrolase family protein [Achromobacter mucicolens]
MVVRTGIALTAALLILGAAPAHSHSLPAPQEAPPPGAPAAADSRILFENVRIFDGTSGELSPASSVLVHGNVIEKVSRDKVSADGARVIDGGGRTLMPGLIDMHWHSMFVGVPLAVAMTQDPTYLNIVAGVEAGKTLMRGFTTVRDLGGSAFSLKRAVDQGVIPGPRIYPSGAMISVTSGHGDFRSMADLPRTLGAPASRHDVAGDSTIADSPDEVRLRTREQLMQGATQIKLTGGGGVSSPHSPLDVVTFTEPELRAAVEAATDWGTYVAVHAYTPTAIQRAIKAGVRSIEHGSMMDEETAQLMARSGVWLSTQPFPDELADAFPRGSDQWQKAQEVFAGTDRTYQLAIKYKLKTAFGTDILFSSQLAAQQGRILASLTRWYTPAQTLMMATGTNAELLKLSGKRNPYRGDLGVVREGALADLLLVDGNPIEDISLIGDPEKNFLVIMKDGVLYKDTVPVR